MNAPLTLQEALLLPRSRASMVSPRGADDPVAGAAALRALPPAGAPDPAVSGESTIALTGTTHYIASKSVLWTLYSVKKCLIDTM